MRMILAWGLFLLVPCPIALLAQHAAQSCDDPQTQVQINTCATQEHERADRELNRVYRQLASRLKGDRLAKLRAAQIAWIKFRDAQCELESAEYARGSMYPAVLSGCLAALTKAQVDVLQRILNDTSK